MTEVSSVYDRGKMIFLLPMFTTDMDHNEYCLLAHAECSELQQLIKKPLDHCFWIHLFIFSYFKGSATDI